MILGVRRHLPRVPGVFGGLRYTDRGYRIDFVDQEYFAHVALHESRHSWQFWLSMPTALGGAGMTDSEQPWGDWLLAAAPDSAKELYDSQYLLAGGLNPDFHFRGEAEFDTDETVRSALERDALRFSAAKAGNTLLCVVQPPTSVSSSAELNPSGGAGAVLKVRVTYEGGFNLPGVPVTWRVVSGTGISGCGPPDCYSEADGTGVATLVLTGQPGPYEIEAAIGPPLDPPDCSGVATVTIQGVIQP